MKILLILLFGCVFFSVFAIVYAIHLKRLKNKVYHTPRLSELHGKAFSDYMDYLTRDL